MPLRGDGPTALADAPEQGAPQRRRPSRRFWVSAVAAAVVLSLGGWLINEVVEQRRTAGLECLCSVRWVADVDSAAAVSSSADLHQQSTVPLRYRQVQGIEVSVINRTSVPQTILGLPGSEFPGWSRLAVGQASPLPSSVSLAGLTSTEPVTIPPGQVRTVVYDWNVNSCLFLNGESIVDRIPLRVRVGWFTRTEYVSLGNLSYALRGVSTRCPGHR